ncbi:secretion ATPase, PEP-CTERM locus subfamily [Solidesulfovibrio carbinoliphilus subsp. oakridgensis]|uniref:Secretion ATPase, PEP-CTERM locus subfamily n=1 Tax=Solidesulfovibrio carbinoliphilus subsp. oakridgensis TaxID=694327 RepID=G7QCG2_9BACT|nr:XrtA/PEP-CTERM system-associated ATPase [Solidesulfovibrio carbinoliphilus]EHJ46118.1 secretion ATPase, PEP-CTERM locus subfamily [Solidesulfovibrio carbinoliphilus subsp. oakridgensis]
MYEAFFNLRRKPFELLPNPEFLYPSRSHKKVLAYLDYGIREHSGFILLTGEVGTGKTTLIRQLIQKHLRDVLLARVFHTKVDSLHLLAMINADLGLETEDKDKPTLLRDLQDFLIAQYAKGRPVVLIIDEAQNLSPDVLEEVRMLSNLETENNKLLHIILVGQPELRRVLASPELLQFRQRIQIVCNIEPLSEDEVEHYIQYRLEAAGNRNAIELAPECFSIIHGYSRGIPRLINILCDYILLDAFANETRTVTAAAIQEIAQDLSFNSQYWESLPPDLPGIEEKASRRDRGRQSPGKLHGVLLNFNTRLQNLEIATASRPPDHSGELRALLGAISQRMDDMGQTLDALSEIVRAAPQPEVAYADMRNVPVIELEESESDPDKEALPVPQPDGKHESWLKRLFFGHC